MLSHFVQRFMPLLFIFLTAFLSPAQGAKTERGVSFFSSKEYNLDRVKMKLVKTYEKGVADKNTIFTFSQNQGVISGEFAGGNVLEGYFIGKFLSENQITFSYCQMQKDGSLDSGNSVCELSKNPEGKILLTERFEWKSRPGEFGVNIYQEI